MKYIFICFFVLGMIGNSFAQTFTRADSLRGNLNPDRTCYDVGFYDLKIDIDIEKKYIKGEVLFQVNNIREYKKMQIDLFNHLKINKISQNGVDLNFTREANAVFISFPKNQKKNKISTFTVFYEGTPIAAKKAPWDGGFDWKTDENGEPWIATACEGMGASSWWACKDHLSDEPDSMRIRFIVPKDLTAVSNGKFISKKPIGNDKMQFEWFVSNPINNYNVSLNLADYVHFTDTFTNNLGDQILNYYVLKNNLEKAKTHFQQVKPMLECFESKFGKYPFWEDGYKLVEVPYWGMEHQSAVAYGNNYKNNDFGFDFIIVHESGHEWFGNSLSANDHAEMWIHESFTTYAETILMECLHGKDSAMKYINTQKKRLVLKEPMIGPKNVNYTNNDVDVYFKGAWLLQTLREVVNNDGIWFGTLKAFAEEFEKQNIDSEQIIEFFNEKTKMDLTRYFNEYLLYAKLPAFHYKIEDNVNAVRITCWWEANQANFDMPVKVRFGEQIVQIKPTTKLQEFFLGGVTASEVQILDHLMLYEPILEVE